MLIKDTFTAGQSKEFTEENDFFRVLEATGEMTLIFYFNGKEVGRADKVKEGYSEKFLIERFNKVVIKNEATFTQTIQFVARLGHEVEYNKTPVGDVNVKNIADVNVKGNVNTWNATSNIVSGTALVQHFGGNLGPCCDPRSNRKILIIENQHATVALRIYFSDINSKNGSPSGGESFLRLKPMERIVFDKFVPLGSVWAESETQGVSVPMHVIDGW
jgi:hypothetical protein